MLMDLEHGIFLHILLTTLVICYNVVLQECYYKIKKGYGGMKRLVAFLSVVLLFVCCNFVTYAEEYMGEEGVITIFNEEGNASRAVGSDVKTVTITQIGTPYIPQEPYNGNVVEYAEVIYRLKFRVTALRYDGKPVTNTSITSITYTGPIEGSKFTRIDSSGIGYVEVDVRGTHNITLLCNIGNVKSNTVSATPTISAYYESTFYCSAYNTALESDYSGPKVAVSGITDATFKSDFIAQVKMNGSGKTDTGTYIHYSGNNTFTYLAPTTCTGTTPVANKTIAVDNTYIPRDIIGGRWKRATVNIEGIGNCVAEDKGGGINGYHIDIYKGIGKESLRGWGNTYLKVKLISVN